MLAFLSAAPGLNGPAHMSGSPSLDHLPAVSRRIAEAGIDAAIAVDWFLRDLDPPSARNSS
jgi:hypothetical protein